MTCAVSLSGEDTKKERDSRQIFPAILFNKEK